MPPTSMRRALYPSQLLPTVFISSFLATCVSRALEEASDIELSPILPFGDGLDRPVSQIFNTCSGPEENSQSVLQPVHFDPVSRLRERVSLPADTPTKSFWLDTHGANPLAEEGSTGKLTDDADVCVIGSGITGVSVAWHLSELLRKDGPALREKTSVVILEARLFCSGATGRNGGHLTRNVFSSFLARQATHNTSEAIKSYLLEQYTANALVRFISERNLEDEVDLVEGGHVTIFRSEEEEIDARRNWEAAKDAGLDVNVTWIGTDEMIEDYGLNRGLNYTGVSFAGHNLWPCKLVTQLFKNSQSASDNVDVFLHTKTPVTAITRHFGPLSHSITESSTTQHRRWKLHTARGDIACTYVVHATNAYAAHLLPFLAGIEVSMEQPSSCPAADGDQPPPDEEDSPQPPHSYLELAPPSRGLYGIVPTRGQVGAVRASVGSSELGWRNSWDGGGGGWEYWFPRYQNTKTHADWNDSNVDSASRNPLIILGGGREFSGGKLEVGVADDASVNPLVSKALRAFLPRFFPDQFVAPSSGKEKEAYETALGDAWEMEWTGIMGFTKGGDPFVGPVVPPQEFAINNSNESNNLDTQYEGQYIAAGYTGHGMPRAYACAEVVARMIKAQIRGEAWTRPSWLPERYLTWATHP